MTYEHQATTGTIIKAFYTVYNTLDHGFLEKVYQTSLAIEIQTLRLPVTPQAPIQVHYRNHLVGDYPADLLVRLERYAQPPNRNRSVYHVDDDEHAVTILRAVHWSESAAASRDRERGTDSHRFPQIWRPNLRSSVKRQAQCAMRHLCPLVQSSGLPGMILLPARMSIHSWQTPCFSVAAALGVPGPVGSLAPNSQGKYNHNAREPATADRAGVAYIKRKAPNASARARPRPRGLGR